MNKQILFSLLLITNTAIHGMEDSNNKTELKVYNSNPLPFVTKQLCIDHNYQPKKIRNDIRALSDTNKFFHNYYAQEKTKQSIIRQCAHYNNSNDEYIAHKLGCHTIKKKIDYLSTVIRNQQRKFTKDDLRDPWYLNSTTNCINRSLLFITIDHLNLEKAEQIIEHSRELDFRYGRNQNILLKIADLRHKSRWTKQRNKDECEKLLSIAQSLLQRKISPNRGSGNGSTPLIEAAFYGDKLFANLLLEYGADPYIPQYSLFTKKSSNAFELEEGEPKGWLKEMVKTNKNSKETRLVLQQAENKLCREHNEALRPDLLKFICMKPPYSDSTQKEYRRLMSKLNHDDYDGS